MNLRLRKSAFGLILFGVVWLAGLSAYRSTLIEDQSRHYLEVIRPVHALLGGAQSELPRDSLPSDLLSYRKVSFSHAQGLERWVVQELERQDFSGPTVFQHGRQLELLVALPGLERTAVLYTFDATRIVWRILGGLALGFVIAIGAANLRSRLKLIWSLRTKFVIAIIAINLITAGIIFWSLSILQTREQTQRIEKQSAIFAGYSTERLIRAFLESFERSYYERFLPEVRSVIASNEDLARIRILSAKNERVLFDSEATAPRALLAAAEFPADFGEQLAASGMASRAFQRDGERWFSVVNTFRGPTQAALFRVEFLYRYRSLERSLDAIRTQILMDLVPSLALGAVLALILAQFLISPIRRLVAALGRVSSGDYAASVQLDRADEMGELASAFNSMTDELRRKQELRKYLSNFSYEQITKAVDLVAADGRAEVPKLGGTRVAATILFCDIRDFVSHCESLEAEEVTSMLNGYFSEMVAVIHKNGGEVDKFIGDAILAVFYPEESKTSEAATSLQAVYCALEMRSRLAAFNQKRESAGKRSVDIGIGISFGEIISGPIGAENRMDFTVIGDVVNVASRIEKLSKQGRHTKILFSQSVESQVHGLLRYEEIAGGLRGKSEELRVFELIGIRELKSLIDNLQVEDPKLRARSVEVLGQSGNPAALEPLLESLNDSDDSVRILASAAVAKLAARNDDRSLTEIFNRLRSEKSPRVSSALIASVGKICRNERVLELEPWLSSEDERIVANAIESIGQARSARGTDLILPSLESRNHRIKANAAMAAFAAGKLEVIDILKPMLMHSDPYMRSSAAFAIGELTLIADVQKLTETLRSSATQTRQVLAELQECVPMLVALLKDPESMVKRQAVIALGKIKDRGAILPLIGLLETPEIIPDVLEALRTIGSHRLVRELLAKIV